MKHSVASALLISCLVPGTVHALDAACEMFIGAAEARTKVPAWQSLTEIGTKMKMEAMKADGKFYKRLNGGAWQVSPASIDDAEKKFIAQIRSGTVKLQDCKNEGTEKVEGVETTVISYRLEVPGAPPANAKLYIGKADGLPYAQSSPETKSTYHYKDVVPPKL